MVYFFSKKTTIIKKQLLTNVIANQNSRKIDFWGVEKLKKIDKSDSYAKESF